MSDRKNPLRTPLDADDVPPRPRIHVRWTDGNGSAIPLCGKELPIDHKVTVDWVVYHAENQTRERLPCIACLQLLSELMRYRDARLAGPPEYRMSAQDVERSTGYPMGA